MMKRNKIILSIICVVGFFGQSDSRYYLNKLGDHNEHHSVRPAQSNSNYQEVNRFNQHVTHNNYYNLAENLYTILNILLNYGRGNKPPADLYQDNTYNTHKKIFKGPRFIHFQNAPKVQNEKYLLLQEIKNFASNHIKDGDASTTTEPAALLGISVMVPIEELDQMVFDERTKISSEESRRKQCIQDCQSSSSYNPVCGSNNVTFFNKEKFMCARNCGVDIYVLKQGECM